MHNDVRGRDPNFDKNWEQTIHDRAMDLTIENEEVDKSAASEQANLNIRTGNHRRAGSARGARGTSGGPGSGRGAGSRTGGKQGDAAAGCQADTLGTLNSGRFGNSNANDYHRDARSRSNERTPATQQSKGPMFGSEMITVGELGYQPQFDKSAKMPTRKSPGAMGERSHTTI